MIKTLPPENSPKSPPNKRSLLTLFFTYLGWISLVAIFVFIFIERTFYLTSVENRLLHPLTDYLKSSGYLGLSFGIAGTLLMILNLGYLVRRHWLQIKWLGPLRHWMTFHVFTGLIGGGLILLHSTFLLRSAIGSMAFYALIIVTVTGLLGRYIYSRVPRSLEGKELELDEIRIELANYRDKLAAYGVRHALLQFANATNPYEKKAHGFLASFSTVVFGDPVLKKNFETLKKIINSTPQLHAEAKNLIPLTKKFCQIHQWFFRYDQLRSFMSSWRFFHRWFAILLMVTILFHVGLSMVLGDLWILK